MTKKKVALDKEKKDNTTQVKETTYWELMGYSAIEWQGRLDAQRVGCPEREMALYENEFSDFTV